MKAALLFTVIAGLAIGGLGLGVAAYGASTKPIKAKFACNRGHSLTVVFKGSRATVTPKGGKSVVLRQALAADGYYYTKGKYGLRGRGNTATWTTGHGKPLHCRER